MWCMFLSVSSVLAVVKLSVVKPAVSDSSARRVGHIFMCTCFCVYMKWVSKCMVILSTFTRRCHSKFNFFFFLSNIPFFKGFSSFEQVWHCNLVMQWSVQPEASNANVTVLLRFMSLNCSIMLTDRHLVATITWNYLWVIIYFVLTRPHTLIPVIV